MAPMSRVEFQVAPTYRVRGREGTVMPLVPVRVGGIERPIVADGGVVPAVFTPETVIVVIDCPFVRRRIRAGDFVLVPDDPPPAPAGKKSAKAKEE